jgi:ribosomal-protein-serine acetyltransferase
MTRWEIDDEITLILIHESDSLAVRYAELVNENHDYLAQWLSWPKYCTHPGDFGAFIKDSSRKYKNGQAMNCAIEFRREIVGNVGFNTIDHHRKVVEIGYWIGQKYQGNGIVTRSCRFLINYAFNELNMKKVKISAAKENRPSRAVCERLGMRLQGILPNQEKIDDRMLSHAIYVILRADVISAEK